MRSNRPTPPTRSRRLSGLILLCSFFAAMLLLLASCTSRGPAATTGSDEPITLEFWDFPHLPRTAEHIRRTITEFEQENPGVRIRYTKLPWQDGQQKVVLSVNAGQPPDICGQVNVSPQFIAQDVLEPVDKYIAPLRHDFYPSYLDAVSYKDKVWAFPWYKAGYVMLLNLEVFKRLGVEPPKEGRWTWEEFHQKMKQLTTQGEDGTRTWGLVTNLGPAEYEAYSILFNAGGRILQRRADGSVEATVDEPEFLAGLRRLQTLNFESQVCFGDIGAMNQEQSWNSWRDTRNIAVTIQGAWCIGAVKDYNKQMTETNARLATLGKAPSALPLDWAIAAPPSEDANTTPVLGSSGLGTYVLFKQKDERKRDLAAKFVLKLITGEGQRVMKDENAYPSLRSTGNLYADDPMLSPVFALFPEGVTNPLVPGGERVDRVLQNEIQRALLRGPDGKPQATAEEATQRATLKLEAILERARRRFGE